MLNRLACGPQHGGEAWSIVADMQYTTFYLGGEYLGIDIRLVREIHKSPEITPVALAPDYIRGLLNLRGQVVTVIDLAVRLGISRRDGLDNPSCLVLKTTGELEQAQLQGQLDDDTSPDQVALLVDRIGDIVGVDRVRIEEPPANMNRMDGRFVSSVVKLDDKLLVTLRMSELLKT